MHKLPREKMLIPEHSSRARKSSLIAENGKKKKVWGKVILKYMNEGMHIFAILILQAY